jgi:hypothetical protein
MEIKISHKPVPYKEAMDFLEKKVEKVHADIEDEINLDIRTRFSLYKRHKCT